MSQRDDLVHFSLEDAGYVLNLTLTDRQLTILYFALTAMEKVHKKKPAFLSQKGITQIEIREIKAILEDSGNDGSILPVPPNAYIV